jgi:hypothetical protein
MRRSTIVAAVAVVWMSLVIIGDLWDGTLSFMSAFAAFVLVVGVFELAKARARKSGAQ